jgi:hypothetical protein
MNLFKTLQVPETQRYWIRQARVPICFLPGGPKTAVDRDGATLIDLLVDNERIAAIEPAGATASPDFPAIDLEAHHVWPTLIDMHAHLDKGHIVTRPKIRTVRSPERYSQRPKTAPIAGPPTTSNGAWSSGCAALMSTGSRRSARISIHRN